MKEFPLTFPQEDIYFEQMAFPGKPIYNIGAKILIRGSIDPQLMELAYRAMVDQHDTFHSVIKLKAHLPWMCVLDEYQYRWQFHDYSTKEDPVTAAEAFCEHDFSQPFDLLSNELLHTFHLIKIDHNFYYLYSRYHHITTDGWGTALLYQRLTAFYNELLEHGAITQRYLRSYDELLAWEDEYKRTGIKEDTEYWRQQFNQLSPELFSPVQSALSNNANPRSGSLEFYCPRTTYDKILTFCAEQKVSPFHYWLGLLFTYFGRMMGVNDMTIGIPLLNRSSARFKQTVGTFMMVSPFRLVMDPHLSFTDLLQQIKKGLRQDYKHQRLPMRNLLEAVGVNPADAGLLYPIFFSYEKHNYADCFKDCTTTVIPLTHHMERTPIAVYVRDFDETDDVKVDFHYNHLFFDQQTAIGHLSRIEALCEKLVDDPHTPLAEYEYLTETDKQQVCGQFPGDAPQWMPQDQFLRHFRQMVDGMPDAPCIIFEGNRYTYQQAYEQVINHVAWLQQNKVKQHDLVALVIDRSPEMLYYMLAILFCGAVHLTIDPAFPGERIRYILSDSGAKWVITERLYLPLVEGGEADCTVLLTERFQGSDNIYALQAMPDLKGNDLAYILYTSGSTGQPKGVAITHDSLCNFLLSMRNRPGIKAGDRLLAVTTYSFDIALLELYLPLISGGTIVIAGRNEQQDPYRIIELIEKHQPDIIQATPAFWSLLLEAGWKGRQPLTILCGGEKMKPSLAHRLLKCCSALWNMYGPTETTIWSAIKNIKHEQDAASIGRPIANTLLFVFNAQMQPVPVGQHGEILIGGRGLATGYHKKDRLTNERFVYFNYNGEKIRLYRTGDIGYWMPNGELAYVGRKDEQVKIRGYRIELSEIENVLTRYDAVSAAAVSVHEDDGEYDKSLVAYIILNRTIDTAMLASYAAGILPRYMVPDHWIILDQFPLTPNGKLDKKRLPALSQFSNDAAVGSAEIVSRNEPVLKDIWQQILGHATIMCRDNFFEKGGNSFKILQLITAIQTRLGITCTFSDIFRCPVFKSQLELLSKGAARTSSPHQFLQSQDTWYLSSFQQHIWLISQAKEGSLAYTLWDAYCIEGVPDYKLFEQVADLLMRRHEILRTVIHCSAGIPSLVVQSVADYGRPVQIKGQMSLGAIKKTITYISDRPLDIEKGPLWEIILFPINTGKYIMFIRLHHLICDGASLDIITREFFDIYAHLLKGERWQPAPLPFQFKEYAAWSNLVLQSPQLEEANQFWEGIFKTRPSILTWPVVNEGARLAYAGKTSSFIIPEQLSLAVYRLAGLHDTTSFIVMLAAFYQMLRLESGNNDITVCIPVAGRELPELQNQVGTYINTVALRVSLVNINSFVALMKAVNQEFSRVVQYHWFPFQQVAEIIDNRHGIEANHCFNVMLNYQVRENLEARSASGLKLSKVNLDHKQSKFDLCINCYEEKNQVRLEIEYKTSFFEEETINRLAYTYIHILENATSGTDDFFETTPSQQLLPVNRNIDISFDL